VQGLTPHRRYVDSPLKKWDRHLPAIILPGNFARTVGASPLVQRTVKATEVQTASSTGARREH
jgi:hypothetical protein